MYPNLASLCSCGPLARNGWSYTMHRFVVAQRVRPHLETLPSIRPLTLAAPRSECGGQRDVVRACLGALRQLAHSDTVKKLLAESGAIEQVRGAGHGGGMHRNGMRGPAARFRVG